MIPIHKEHVSFDLQTGGKPCIFCRFCQPICPEGLDPHALLMAIQTGHLKHAHKLGLMACTACGACDVVCPSHIPLAKLFLYWKNKSIEKEEAYKRAQLARKRFYLRKQRLAQRERERTKRPVQKCTNPKEERTHLLKAALERAKGKGGPST